MKLSIKTQSIELDYEDEYSHITEDATKRITEIIKAIPFPIPNPNIPTGIIDGTGIPNLSFGPPFYSGTAEDFFGK